MDAAALGVFVGGTVVPIIPVVEVVGAVIVFYGALVSVMRHLASVLRLRAAADPRISLTRGQPRGWR